jgi:hypothetical protein
VSDRIVLTIPREQPFHRVAHLVLGGLAVRLNLTVENLEDLQVAFDELLGQDDGGTDVTLELAVTDGTIEAEMGPFDSTRLRASLEPGQESFSLHRVLHTVVDDVELTERDGAQWIRLTKSVDPAEAA